MVDGADPGGSSRGGKQAPSDEASGSTRAAAGASGRGVRPTGVQPLELNRSTSLLSNGHGSMSSVTTGESSGVAWNKGPLRGSFRSSPGSRSGVGLRPPAGAAAAAAAGRKSVTYSEVIGERSIPAADRARAVPEPRVIVSPRSGSQLTRLAVSRHGSTALARAASMSSGATPVTPDFARLTSMSGLLSPSTVVSRPSSPSSVASSSVGSEVPDKAKKERKERKRKDALLREAALKKKRHVDRLLLFNRLEPENKLGPLNLLVYCWARDEESYAPDLQVPDTLVISNGHPTFWVFTNRRGALKMKNAQRLRRREEILRAFLGPTGHRRGVVATYVDPDRGLSGEAALELTEEDLRAFLGDKGPLSLMDGLLQRYIRPFGETNILIYAQWELNGNFEIERVHKENKSRTSAEAAGNAQRVFAQPLSADPPETLRARILHKCNAIYDHVLAVSPQRYQISRMRLVFKHDSEGRLWLLWCSELQLSVAGLEVNTPKSSASFAAMDESIRRLQAQVKFMGNGRILPWESTGRSGLERPAGSFAGAHLTGAPWDRSDPDYNSGKRVTPALAALPPILPSVLRTSLVYAEPPPQPPQDPAEVAAAAAALRRSSASGVMVPPAPTGPQVFSHYGQGHSGTGRGMPLARETSHSRFPSYSALVDSISKQKAIGLMRPPPSPFASRTAQSGPLETEPQPVPKVKIHPVHMPHGWVPPPDTPPEPAPGVLLDAPAASDGDEGEAGEDGEAGEPGGEGDAAAEGEAGAEEPHASAARPPSSHHPQHADPHLGHHSAAEESSAAGARSGLGSGRGSRMHAAAESSAHSLSSAASGRSASGRNTLIHGPAVLTTESSAVSPRRQRASVPVTAGPDALPILAGRPGARHWTSDEPTVGAISAEASLRSFPSLVGPLGGSREEVSPSGRTGRDLSPGARADAQLPSTSPYRPRPSPGPDLRFAPALLREGFMGHGAGVPPVLLPRPRSPDFFAAPAEQGKTSGRKASGRGESGRGSSGRRQPELVHQFSSSANAVKERPPPVVVPLLPEERAPSGAFVEGVYLDTSVARLAYNRFSQMDDKWASKHAPPAPGRKGDSGRKADSGRRAAAGARKLPPVDTPAGGADAGAEGAGGTEGGDGTADAAFHVEVSLETLQATGAAN